MKMRRENERIILFVFHIVNLWDSNSHEYDDSMTIKFNSGTCRGRLTGMLASRAESWLKKTHKKHFSIQNFPLPKPHESAYRAMTTKWMRQRWKCIFTRRQRRSVLFVCRRAIRQHESGMNFLRFHFLQGNNKLTAPVLRAKLLYEKRLKMQCDNGSPCSWRMKCRHKTHSAGETFDFFFAHFTTAFCLAFVFGVAFVHYAFDGLE